MSFTQEKETNLHNGPDGTICDGCDKRCEFGIHYFYRHTSSLEDWFCPTINGNPIKQYKGPNGQIIDVSRKEPFHLDVVHRSAEEQAIELAHEIVKYCDRYKQDTPQTNPQTNDEMIQVRLYDYLDKWYCNLGAPVSMGCALALLKRLRDVPRPGTVCLDDKMLNRFKGFRAELTTYYPGRYSDYANGVLSLIAPYRYTCSECEMGENHSANMQVCAENIMSGKCRDEFIRQTVGVTLFPEHYAAKKQR